VHATRDQATILSQEGAEAAQAASGLRQQGAGLYQQIVESVHAARQQASVLSAEGREAADAAADAMLQTTALLEQSTATAQGQWQSGVEKLQRGLYHTSAAWTVAYLDRAVLVANIAGVIAIGGFLILGFVLICTPLRTDLERHGAFDRMFWLTQGLYLIIFSVPAFMRTLQFGVLRENGSVWPVWLMVEQWMPRMLNLQIGRALFFLTAGFYVFPLMDNFASMAEVNVFFVFLSYCLGCLSLLCGTFLLVFDVVLGYCVQQAPYETVPTEAFP